MNGAGADSPTESVSVTGAQGRTQDFGGRQRRRPPGTHPGISRPHATPRCYRLRRWRGTRSGRWWRARRRRGWRPDQIGRLGGRGFNVNQPHGVLYFSDDNSALDATPYSLSGIESTAKSEYNSVAFGANVGGPLNIPKIFNGGNKWFFFFGWNGSRGSTPYDSYSTVPTAAERAGDFSGASYRDGSPVQIFDPITGLPLTFNGRANVIDPARISSAASNLLQYIPFPNLPAGRVRQNFHYVTSDDSNTDAVICA